MNRKLLALLGASILSLVTPTFAAQSVDAASAASAQGSEKERRDGALERFKSALKQLDLTTQQESNIKSIFGEARSKLKALKGETDAKAQRHEIIEQARKDIIAVLDKPQKAKLIEILKDDKTETKA